MHISENTAVRAVVRSPGKAAPLGVLCFRIGAFTFFNRIRQMKGACYAGPLMQAARMNHEPLSWLTHLLQEHVEVAHRQQPRQPQEAEAAQQRRDGDRVAEDELIAEGEVHDAHTHGADRHGTREVEDVLVATRRHGGKQLKEVWNSLQRYESTE